jgi:hypothetical protein
VTSGRDWTLQVDDPSYHRRLSAWAADEAAVTDEAFPADFTVYGLCCPGDGSAWDCGYAKTGGGPVRAAVWHRVAR